MRVGKKTMSKKENTSLLLYAKYFSKVFLIGKSIELM